MFSRMSHCFVLFFCFVVVFFFSVTPHRNCRLKLLKSERIKDYLLLEEEFIQNQERLKPQEEKNEVHYDTNMLHQFLLCMNVHVHILYMYMYMFCICTLFNFQANCLFVTTCQLSSTILTIH